MAKETTHYGFTKPDLADSPPDITAMNHNWDEIDEKLFNLEQGGGTTELEAKVDAINTKIGETGDSDGNETTGSVFAKLNKLIKDLASHMTLWNSTKAQEIATINTNVGKNVDEGNDTVFAKLNDIQNTLSAGVGKTLKSYKTDSKYSPGTVTLINAVGSGCFYIMSGDAINPKYCTKLQILVDEVDISDVLDFTGDKNVILPLKNDVSLSLENSANLNYGEVSSSEPLYFKKSFKVVATLGDGAPAGATSFHGEYALYE